MKGLKILVLMLILFISLGAACAAEPASGEGLSDEDSNDFKTPHDNVHSTNKLKNTFSDLNELIENSDYVLEIDLDYKYTTTQIIRQK